MLRELIALSPQSKTWIYPCDRELSYDEIEEIRELLFPFLEEWTSHSHSLMTYGNVFHRQFIALFVDELQANAASGCSIDTSVHFIEQLGSKLGANFFNRTHIQYMIEEDIFQIPLTDIKSKLDDGTINKDTWVFDHSVTSKDKFIKNWVTPLENTWMKKYLK